jgi:hypothetical protein
VRNVAPLVGFSLLLLAGCTSSRFSPVPVRQVLTDYRSIERGMPEKRVLALLGSPDSIGRDGTRHWWVDAPEGQLPSHADLDVVFDRDGKVGETRIQSDEKSDVNGACGAVNVSLPQTAFSR